MSKTAEKMKRDHYNFSLWTDKIAMRKYLAICKENDTTAAKEISAFVAKAVAKYEEQAEEYYVQQRQKSIDQSTN